MLVALSGGVDSSVAAALLLEQGWAVEGATLRVWDPGQGCPDPKRSRRMNACCSMQDALDAAAVARRLGIPFSIVEAGDAFRDHVLDPARAAYEAGRTPNPCVPCNRFVKLGALRAWAAARGIERLATGHYARVEAGTGGTLRLLRGVDRAKDQTYFLYFLTPDDLATILFPLGGLPKAEVRERARALGLGIASKPESQDLCVPLGRAERPGPIVDTQGRVLGAHRGVAFYTIGQRRGLGVPGVGRRYVVDLDATNNRVVLGTEADLEVEGLLATCEAWRGSRPTDWTPAHVQVRYRAPAAPAQVCVVDDRLRVRFDVPVRALAPGQAAVVYQGEVCLGGGTILGRYSV